MMVDYELANTEKKAQMDAGSVTAAGLVGVGKKHNNIIKGKFGTGISSKTKHKTWERICLQMNAAFPLVSLQSFVNRS